MFILFTMVYTYTATVSVNDFIKTSTEKDKHFPF